MTIFQSLLASAMHRSSSSSVGYHIEQRPENIRPTHLEVSQPSRNASCPTGTIGMPFPQPVGDGPANPQSSRDNHSRTDCPTHGQHRCANHSRASVAPRAHDSGSACLRIEAHHRPGFPKRFDSLSRRRAPVAEINTARLPHHQWWAALPR